MQKFEHDMSKITEPKQVLRQLDRLFFDTSFSPLTPNQKWAIQLGIIGLEYARPTEASNIGKWLSEIGLRLGRENFDDFIDEIRAEIIYRIRQCHEHLHHRLLFAQAANKPDSLPFIPNLAYRTGTEDIFFDYVDEYEEPDPPNPYFKYVKDSDGPMDLELSCELAKDKIWLWIENECSNNIMSKYFKPFCTIDSYCIAEKLRARRLMVTKFNPDQIRNDRQYCKWIRKAILPLFPKPTQPLIYLDLWHLYCASIMNYFFDPGATEKRFMEKLFAKIIAPSRN